MTVFWARVALSLVVSVSLAVLLVGCGPSGGETASAWLEKQHIVVAVDSSGYFTGLASEPDIYADLDPAADAQAVRELAGDTSDYLAGSGFGGSVVIHYRIGEFVLTPDIDRSGSEAAADLLSAVRADERVLSGELSGAESTLVTALSDLLPVFDERAPGTERLIVRTEDAVWSATGGACGRLTPVVVALFAEPSAISLAADACTETVLGVATPAEVATIALRVAGADGSGTAVRVASDPANGGRGPGLWSISTDAITPVTLPLVSAVIDVGPESLVIDSFGAALGQPSAASIRDAMHALLGPEAPNDANPMAFEYGSLRFMVGDRVEITAYELGTALDRLTLAEKLTGLDGEIAVSASFGVIDVRVHGELDEQRARRLLEAVAPRSSRGEAYLSISDDSGNALYLGENETATAEGDLGDLLLSIWESLV